MAIIDEFSCYICGNKFSMAYGGLFDNPLPDPRERICPWCKDKQKALSEADRQMASKHHFLCLAKTVLAIQKNYPIEDKPNGQ